MRDETRYEGMHAIHLAIYPENVPFGVADDIRLDNLPPLSRHEETEIDLDFPLVVAAFISGSWACWGPADQDTDGDESLHILVYVEDRPTERVVSEVASSLGDIVAVGEVQMFGVLGDATEWSDCYADFRLIMGEPWCEIREHHNA